MTVTQGAKNALVRNPLAGAGDNCPSCGASLAPDQRYCLNCGQRRGDPRLPFMDAVVFMDAARQQPQPVAAADASSHPPPPDRRPLLSANASLVAGVATLVLAIGVGVLIGRSGNSGSSNVAAQTPQIIKVGGGGEVEGTTAKPKEASGGAKSGGSGGSSKAKSAVTKKAKEKTETTSSGATKATEEAYPVAPGVNIAPPEQKLGGECDPSVAGCGKNGKFEGSFFE